MAVVIAIAMYIPCLCCTDRLGRATTDIVLEWFANHRKIFNEEIVCTRQQLRCAGEFVRSLSWPRTRARRAGSYAQGRVAPSPPPLLGKLREKKVSKINNYTAYNTTMSMLLTTAVLGRQHLALVFLQLKRAAQLHYQIARG